MTLLPPVDEIKKLFAERGISEVELNERIEKKKQQYQGFISDKAVLMYLVARDLGIEIPLTMPSESLTVDEAFGITDENEIFSVKGFVGGVWEKKTRRGTNAVYCLLLNEACNKYVRIGFFGKSYEKAKSLKFGEYIQVNNVSWWFRPDMKILTATGLSEIRKLQGGEFNPDRNPLENGMYVSFIGVPIELRKRSYVGCPYCFRSWKDAKEGTEVTCCIPENVKLTSLSWITLTVLSTDGTKRVSCDFGPGMRGDFVSLLGNVVKFYGIYEDQVITVFHYNVIQTVQQTTVPGKIEDVRVSTEQIYELVKSFGVMPMTVLSTMVSRRYGIGGEVLRKLVEKLVSEGKLILENDNVRVRV